MIEKMEESMKEVVVVAKESNDFFKKLKFATECNTNERKSNNQFSIRNPVDGVQSNTSNIFPKNEHPN